MPSPISLSDIFRFAEVHLAGIPLRLTYAQFPPFIKRIGDNLMTGSDVEVWSILQKKMNLTIRYVYQPFISQGPQMVCTM